MVERIRLLLETRQLTPTQFADAIGIARPIVSHILSGRNKPSLEVVQRILAAMPDLSMPWLLNGTGAMQAAARASTLPSPVIVVLPQLDLQPAEKEVFGPVNVAAVNPVPLPPAAPTPLRQNGANLGPAPKLVAVTANLPGPKRFASSPKAALFTAQAAPTQAAPAQSAPAQAAPTQAAFTQVVPIQAASTQAALGLELPTPELPTPELQTAPQFGFAQVFPSAPLQPQPENLSLPLTVPIAPASVLADAGASLVPSIAAALFAGAEKPIRRIVIFYRDGSFADYQPE